MIKYKVEFEKTLLKFGVRTLLDCLAVGAGGFVGAVLRYLIGLIPLEPESGFPIKTFAINIIGCFAIGIIAGLAEKSAIDPRLLLLLKVGVCGGFTTFSSFALEARGLLSAGSTLVFALYVVLSVAVGIAAVILGQIIIK